MVPITDIEIYNGGMRKSLLDKIWFLDKVDSSITAIYDYGCADGALLRMVGEICPDMKLYGYDVSPEMIERARVNVPNAVLSTKNFSENLQNYILNASSVFHEIHSYSPDIRKDYQNIFCTGAEYIAIRDLFYSRVSDRPTDPVQLAKVFQREPKNKISHFEAFNGNVGNNKNFLHYLLKYRYSENWEREVRENYFPHSIEEFLTKIPSTYEVVHFEHYTLPFLRDQIIHDFGFVLSDPTHAKILLHRKRTE